MAEILELPIDPYKITINYDLPWVKLMKPLDFRYDLCFDGDINERSFRISPGLSGKIEFRIKLFRFPEIKSLNEGVKLMEAEYYQPVRIEHLPPLALAVGMRYKFSIPAPGSIYWNKLLSSMPYIVSDGRDLGMGLIFPDSKPRPETIFAGFPMVLSA